MFNAISSNFSWCDPDKLAVLHDRPWTSVRLAKTARKQGLRDTTLLLLSQNNASADERAINVPDAFLKLREQILVYYNAESKMERHGGLNLINLSNLSFFDDSQRSELFRLKAVFLQSLQRRSKANQAFSNAVQICPTHSRAWLTWGEWYVSLGSTAEKQHLEQNPTTDPNDDAAKDVAKKVRQYLSQAIGCFLEATKIDSNEWARMHLPGCLWMLTKDGINGSLCQTFEKRATLLPSWMWLPWIPQLLTSLYRRECIAAKSILMRLAKDYPQAVYYPLRVFYLERRDIDRARLGATSNSQSQTQGSVVHAEELVTALRRSHACLWSYLEPILEELIVKFRPSNEEDLLATVAALLDRSELHFGSPEKKEQEKEVLISTWKTLAKVAQKYFKPTDAGRPEAVKDGRAMKFAAFKDRYKAQFETDFCLTSFESGSGVSKEAGPPIDLPQMVERLRKWKKKLELNLSTLSRTLSLSTESAPLAMFGVGDAPDLWPFSCDPQISDFSTHKCDPLYDLHPSAQSTTSSSAAAALKAASSAAISVASAARLEGVGGSYGGGSSFIEVPGQYAPNTTQTDTRPSPELHVKVLRFGPRVSVDTKSDINVRRVISMEGSDGKSYHFHLGFAFSHLTRTDERTAQTHFVLDKVLRKNNLSSKAELSVQSQPVVPVAQRLRLVSEPENRLSLADACSNTLMVDATGLHHKFVDGVRRLITESTAGGSNDAGIEQTKRLEVFRNIKTTVKKTMLLDYVTDRCDSPEFLFQFRRVFAQQWAINCLLQYGFSASDRTPNKVVMDVSTGRVLAPEFRISYNHQGCFETAPIPFRLTDNLTRFIGQTMIDGKFVKATASEAVHACRHTTDSVYRLLIRDDLVSFLTKGSAKADVKTVELENQLLPSVGRNVATLHGRFAECAPSYQQISPASEDAVVDQTVRDLVASAELDEKQCLMPANFHGWI
jgi:transformation/transcription domain-associated protein